MSCRRLPRIVSCAIALHALSFELAHGQLAAAEPGHAAARAPAKPAAARAHCTACGVRGQLPPWSAPQLSAAAVYGLALACPAPPPAEIPEPGPIRESKRQTAIRDLAFRDNQPLINRLKRLQALPFVTVWDSTAATVYVGMNRDGEPGVHLRQKKHDRGTLLPAGRTLFVDNTSGRSRR